MQLLLWDMNSQLCDAWTKEFSDLRDVSVHNVKLEDAPAADCIVAAGNSFGIMDGGLDAAMAYQFPDVVANIGEGIAAEFYGEIPVGQSLIVPTGDETFPWLCYTPTMRFPRKIAPELVYDAMRGMLMTVMHFNENAIQEQMIAEERGDEPPDLVEIRSIACPGLGTLSGGVGAFTGAKMMRMAYESIFIKKHEPHRKWEEVEGWLAKMYGRA